MASILLRLADYTRGLSEQTLPPHALHAARRAVVDWAAATIPGGTRPPATLLSAALFSEVNTGGARLIPSGARTSPRTAALINGCAAHTIEFDDIFRDALYHPGAPTIAAALALAQDRHADGLLLLRAVVCGYELSTRIGVVVQPTHYNFWHTTGTIGTFGAAAAAGAILGLTVEEHAHALATSGTLAAGLQQAFRSDSMSKPLHSGHAAETGLLSALAAERGVTGAIDILEGARGFGAAMSNNPDFTRALDDIETFNIGQMTFKNHMACGHTFAAIDAMRELRASSGVRPEDVDHIEIGTYAKAIEVAGNPSPTTAFEAQFSLPYCVGMALVFGSVRMAAFTEERLNDPQIRALMNRTHLIVDTAADAVYPRQRAATVTVRTRNGGTLRFHAPTRKGDPDSPLSDDELSDKFLELVGPVLGDPQANKLLAVLWRLDTVADVATLPIASAATSGAVTVA